MLKDRLIELGKSNEVVIIKTRGNEYFITNFDKYGITKDTYAYHGLLIKDGEVSKSINTYLLVIDDLIKDENLEVIRGIRVI